MQVIGIKGEPLSFPMQDHAGRQSNLRIRFVQRGKNTIHTDFMVEMFTGRKPFSKFLLSEGSCFTCKNYRRHRGICHD